MLEDGLRRKIHDLTQDILAEQIEWDAAFGTTVRSDGSVVIGNPRDTIDTGETFESISVDVSPDKLTIKFNNADAEAIFHHRSEIDQIAGERVGGRLAVDIVKYLLNESGVDVR
jgi:hypothetical protein